jgi:hypothetical protein
VLQWVGAWEWGGVVGTRPPENHGVVARGLGEAGGGM